ncbi:MAG: right-handed parallel beta-helix repeat-containing protein [Acidobacteriota bacterium]
MLKFRSLGSSLALGAAVLGVAGFASSRALAQSGQVYVSAQNGNDAGSCTVVSPCRTVTYAMTQVQIFGQVLITDSGDYDSSVEIDKSVTIAAAPGVVAVFSAAMNLGTIFSVGAGPAFCTQQGVCHSLVLRGLTLDGQNVTQDAIRAGGMRLTVEDCYFSRFRFGIYMNGSGTLNIRRTTFREIDQGIYIAPVGVRRTVTAVVEDSSFDALRTNGINADTNGNNGLSLSVHRSRFVNAGVAIRSSASLGGWVQFNVEHSHVANSTTGVISINGSSVVRVSNSTIVNNTTGVSAAIGGVLLTRGNNTVEGNNSNGTFTGGFAAQ